MEELDTGLRFSQKCSGDPPTIKVKPRGAFGRFDFRYSYSTSVTMVQLLLISKKQRERERRGKGAHVTFLERSRLVSIFKSIVIGVWTVGRCTLTASTVSNRITKQFGSVNLCN